MELITEVTISAGVERVWALLTDFERMGTWNPYLRSIRGPLEVGGVLLVEACPSGSVGRTFRAVVLAVEPLREFRWVGSAPIPGLFRGEHVFTLEPLSTPDGQDQVRFVHWERFSGPFVWLHRLFRLRATRRGFEEMNAALKRVAEGP